MGKKLSKYAKDYNPIQGEMSPRMRAGLDKLRIEAREKLIERGLIQFRADREFMEAIHAAAEENHVAVAVLCRDVIWSFLKNQPGFITKENAATKGKKSKTYNSPNGLSGKVSEDLDAEHLIDEAIETLKTAKKKLKNH